MRHESKTRVCRACGVPCALGYRMCQECGCPDWVWRGGQRPVSHDKKPADSRNTAASEGTGDPTRYGVDPSQKGEGSSLPTSQKPGGYLGQVNLPNVDNDACPVCGGSAFGEPCDNRDHSAPEGTEQ